MQGPIGENSRAERGGQRPPWRGVDPATRGRNGFDRTLALLLVFRHEASLRVVKRSKESFTFDIFA